MDIAPALLETVQTFLEQDEGLRLNSYRDTLGYWTVGWGHLIDARKVGGVRPYDPKFVRITYSDAETLLLQDIETKVTELYATDKYPIFEAQTVNCQAALLNMAFQLGVDGLCKFTSMWAHIERGEYVLAGEAALDSLWAKQAPNRALRVAAALRT